MIPSKNGIVSISALALGGVRGVARRQNVPISKTTVAMMAWYMSWFLIWSAIMRYSASLSTKKLGKRQPMALPTLLDMEVTMVAITQPFSLNQVTPTSVYVFMKKGWPMPANVLPRR